jgi:Fic family protein
MESQYDFTIHIPPQQQIDEIETRKVLKSLATTRAALAELKGVAATIPNEQILIETLSLQEAKDSSAIENIVTTHDELYRNAGILPKFTSAAAKEVHHYARALRVAYQETKRTEVISTSLILNIQSIIEGNSAGIRKVPGTVLKNEGTGEVIYTPPQHPDEISTLLSELQKFMHDDENELDPLVKMAIIHHHFESIHPFYDGNGRTGRIINILYLIKEELLDLPILYLSHYIIKNRTEYYRLLQEVRTTENWESWILYMLEAVRETSINTVRTIKAVKQLMLSMKKRIRSEQSLIYSQDLMNNLFRHPYTKIEILMDELQVSRPTAMRYLNILVEMGILEKHRMGRTNYYLNVELFVLLTRSD